MKKIDYITFNDMYSGIYQSQVIDVVDFWNKELNVEARLVAIVPAKHYFQQRKIIKSKISESIVLPLLGSVIKWRRNKYFVKFISAKKNVAVCRGPLAFSLAYGLYDKVAYDGRAAVKAEVQEYDVSGSNALNEDFIKAEKYATDKADAYVAVSKKLVEYWKNDLNLKLSSDYISVIPCTLTTHREGSFMEGANDVVKVVYSGGTGAWQSFELVVELFRKALLSQENLEVLFLTKENKHIEVLLKEFPSRVQRMWLKHSEVYSVLSGCDYGILIRDDKVTNQVASPVKFAEYLNAGLSVLISEKIGDFSQFVLDENCGIIVGESIPFLKSVSIDQKVKFKALSSDKFLKSSDFVINEYLKLFNNLNVDAKRN